jgi:hypothetical protein
MRKSWTDERLDHFAERVDRRFDEVDRRFDKVDREVNRRFDEMDARLARVEYGISTVQRAVVYLAVAQTGAILAGFAATSALIVTHT